MKDGAADSPSRPATPADDGGVCAGEVPPLIGDVLTGTVLTLAQAAARLARDEALPELTPLQRRLVEQYASERV